MTLYEIDRWSSPGSFESVEVISDQEMKSRLDVTSLNTDGLPGKYRLSITMRRVASDPTRPRIAKRIEAFEGYMIGQAYRDNDNPER